MYIQHTGYNCSAQVLLNLIAFTRWKVFNDMILNIWKLAKATDRSCLSPEEKVFEWQMSYGTATTLWIYRNNRCILFMQSSFTCYILLKLSYKVVMGLRQGFGRRAWPGKLSLQTCDRLVMAPKDTHPSTLPEALADSRSM